MSLLKSVTSGFELIGVKQAIKLLENVHPQQAGRHLRTVIDLYAKQMREGKWDENVAQTIAIDADGKLLNGYHRLNALIKANADQSAGSKEIKFRFLMVRGAAPDSFGKWDAGASRSMSYKSGFTIDRTAVLNSIILTALYPTRAPVDIDQLKLTNEMLLEPLEFMEAHITTTRRPRSTGCNIRAGLLLNLMAHPNRRDEICEVSNKYVRREFQMAPPSMNSLDNLLHKSRHTWYEQLVLAYDAFNPKKFDNKFILVKNFRNGIDNIKDKLLKDLAGAIA